MIKQSPELTNIALANRLNEQGFLTGKGRRFTADSVSWIRWKFKLPLLENSLNKGVRNDGYYSTKALADLLGVSIHTVHYWRQKGIIDAYQDGQNKAWWHRITPEIIETLRQSIRRVPTLSPSVVG